jgi:hypothetical protein
MSTKVAVLGARSSLYFVLVALTIVFRSPLAVAQNLLVNGDFSQGSGEQPGHWKAESWIRRDSTEFIWIPPFGSDPGELGIASSKLNDARWKQSIVLPPGLYNAGVDILSRGIPQESWAGAFMSIGDQGVASMDVKGNSMWVRREIFFKTSRDKTKIEVKLRLGGLTNFATGRTFFRNATLTKIDSAPSGALLLDVDANERLWSGSHWTLLLIFLPLVLVMLWAWRLLGKPSES